VREEDRRRKLAFRVLELNGFRTQALNVEYVKMEKEKCSVKNELYRAVIENAVFAAVQIDYLISTQCGIKQQNVLVYISIVCNLALVVASFLTKLISCTYYWKRLRAYGYKLDVKIANE